MLGEMDPAKQSISGEHIPTSRSQVVKELNIWRWAKSGLGLTNRVMTKYLIKIVYKVFWDVYMYILYMYTNLECIRELLIIVSYSGKCFITFKQQQQGKQTKTNKIKTLHLNEGNYKIISAVVNKLSSLKYQQIPLPKFILLRWIRML